jgi:dUTP pyrophosphatase
MIINFVKLHENAVIPTKAHPWDACFDLTSISMRVDEDYGFIEYDTGIACEIDRGFCGLVYPRSSISKYDLTLANGIAVIDSGYNSSILLRFKPALRFYIREWKGETSIEVNNVFQQKVYNIGDKIGQFKIVPVDGIEFNEVNKLKKTARGAGGFGSTGV